MANSFFMSFTFPRAAKVLVGLYLLGRISYTRGYLSHRGYNRVEALNEVLKMLLVFMICGSFFSGLKMTGFFVRPKAGWNPVNIYKA